MTVVPAPQAREKQFQEKAAVPFLIRIEKVIQAGKRPRDGSAHTCVCCAGCGNALVHSEAFNLQPVVAATFSRVLGSRKALKRDEVVHLCVHVHCSVQKGNCLLVERWSLNGKGKFRPVDAEAAQMMINS